MDKLHTGMIRTSKEGKIQEGKNEGRECVRKTERERERERWGENGSSLQTPGVLNSRQQALHPKGWKRSC